MFADSLLDSPWGDRSRRGWTTLLSFAVQTLGVATLLALPLIYTEGLPKLQLLQSIAPPSPPPGPPPAPEHRAVGTQRESNLLGTRLVPPGRIPIDVMRVDETEPPNSGSPCTYCVPGGTGQEGPGQVFNTIPGNGPFPPPLPPKHTTEPPRISRMMEGNLIYKVQPVYPPLARSARIQGPVVLRAIISRAGTIENLQVLSGHPLLVKAAIDAVSRWRYRPYILNGDPVEVETQVTVNFLLSGG